MKLTKEQRKRLKALDIRDKEILFFENNVRKVKIFNESEQRITHKKFIETEGFYNFLYLALYAVFHGSAQRRSFNGTFTFEYKRG